MADDAIVTCGSRNMRGIFADRYIIVMTAHTSTLNLCMVNYSHSPFRRALMAAFTHITGSDMVLVFPCRGGAVMARGAVAGHVRVIEYCA